MYRNIACQFKFYKNCNPFFCVIVLPIFRIKKQYYDIESHFSSQMLLMLFVNVYEICIFQFHQNFSSLNMFKNVVQKFPDQNTSRTSSKKFLTDISSEESAHDETLDEIFGRVR